jgi:hypothetical protein
MEIYCYVNNNSTRILEMDSLNISKACAYIIKIQKRENFTELLKLVDFLFRIAKKLKK